MRVVQKRLQHSSGCYPNETSSRRRPQIVIYATEGLAGGIIRHYTPFTPAHAAYKALDREREVARLLVLPTQSNPTSLSDLSSFYKQSSTCLNLVATSHTHISPSRDRVRHIPPRRASPIPSTGLLKPCGGCYRLRINQKLLPARYSMARSCLAGAQSLAERKALPSNRTSVPRAALLNGITRCKVTVCARRGLQNAAVSEVRVGSADGDVRADCVRLLQAISCARAALKSVRSKGSRPICV